MKDYNDLYRQSFDRILHIIKMVIANGIHPGNEEWLLATLRQAFDFDPAVNSWGVFPELHRLTINRQILGSNKRIEDIKYLKYPPPEAVKSYGRCNKPRQSVLYASFGMLSIYSEVKPKIGDLVTMSTWKAKDESGLNFYPIFYNQPPDGTININMYQYMKDFQKRLSELPPNFKYMLDKLTQFVADAFTQRFEQNSNDIKYLVSAYYADKMLNEIHDGNIDAIFYPSVQQKLAFENVAIKPKSFDEKYYLSAVEQSIVVSIPDASGKGYFSEGISDSKEFNYEDGKILWSGKYTTVDSTADHYIKNYDYSE